MNPEPLIFAPRATSTMPSSPATSQCGRTPVASRGVPQLRTIALCDSSPAGTSSRVMLGSSSIRPCTVLSVAVRSASSRAISAPTDRLSATSSVTSSPARFFCATSCVITLRRALRSSTAVMSARRSFSSPSRRSRIGPSVSSFPRRAKPSRNRCICSRTSRRSCMDQNVGIPVANDRKLQLG